jgi:hypothetical protein
MESQVISSNEFEIRLQLAVKGLNPYFRRLLLEISKQNSTYIIDFAINELKRENNASISYVRINIYAIAQLVKYNKKSDLKEFTKEDVLSYLDSLKKTETQDPMHVIFKSTSGGKQYAEVLVNGKTGSRHIPLISSIPT